MRIALCNEVLRQYEFPRQCELAAALGYDGLEVAPFTLDAAPESLERRRCVALRRAAADAGIAITSLHWLLVAPKGLSLTSADPMVRSRTHAVMTRMVDLCAELGADTLVHGSPAQRQLPADLQQAQQARAWAMEAWEHAARSAERLGVTYCIEPLAQSETNYINTVAEACSVVDQIGSKALRTMIDTCAAGRAEQCTVAELIERWVPNGYLTHVQLNDTNQRAPGQGRDDFASVISALSRCRYRRTLSVEPFVYEPDGLTAAARAIGYVRGLMEALQ